MLPQPGRSGSPGFAISAAVLGVPSAYRNGGVTCLVREGCPATVIPDVCRDGHPRSVPAEWLAVRDCSAHAGDAARHPWATRLEAAAAAVLARPAPTALAGALAPRASASARRPDETRAEEA